jgi:hypothetical protein
MYMLALMSLWTHGNLEVRALRRAEPIGILRLGTVDLSRNGNTFYLAKRIVQNHWS